MWTILQVFINLLQYCFCFIFRFVGYKACEILAPQLWIEPTPLALEGKVLTTRSPGKSQSRVILKGTEAREPCTEGRGCEHRQSWETCGCPSGNPKAPKEIQFQAPPCAGTPGYTAKEKTLPSSQTWMALSPGLKSESESCSVVSDSL